MSKIKKNTGKKAWFETVHHSKYLVTVFEKFLKDMTEFNDDGSCTRKDRLHKAIMDVLAINPDAFICSINNMYDRIYMTEDYMLNRLRVTLDDMDVFRIHEADVSEADVTND